MDSPKIPTLKDSQKPQVKVRGLEAGVTLFDRLKQFKKKDLAFILAGLGTLFMAPLAEHFMMAPETGSDLQAGMGGGKGGSGSGLFNGTGSSPYEPGSNGLAQGSPSGGGSDIITPLNVRDPSALVMGPGAVQQPPTQSVAPATPPPTAPVASKDSDLKDALAASARGVGAAAKAAKALLPVPKVALQGAGGLRGLGVASGGSSAVGSVGPINSSNSLSKANTGGGLSAVKAVPGYRGAAGSRGQASGGSGIEALKAAGDKAGSRMNEGSAASALDATAAQSIPGGGSGLGGNGAGGSGANDKGASGNQDKSAKNVGESLEFLKQKAMQDAKVALWSKEQEANDMNLQMANMRNDALKTIVSDGFAKPLATCIGNMMGGGPCIQPTTGNYVCAKAGSSPASAIPPIQMSDLGSSSCDSKSGKPFYKVNEAGGTNIYRCVGGQGVLYGTGCVRTGFGQEGGDDKNNDGSHDNGAGGSGTASSMGSPPVTNLKPACDTLTSAKNTLEAKGAEYAAAAKTVGEMITAAQQVTAVRDAIGSASGTGTTPTHDCGTGAPAVALKSKVPVLSQLNSILGNLRSPDKGVVAQLDSIVPLTSDEAKDKFTALNDSVNKQDDKAPGVVPAIMTFSGDVDTLTQYKIDPNNSLTRGLGLSQTQFAALAGDPAQVASYTRSLTGAADSIRTSAQSMKDLVSNLALAKGDLTPLVAPAPDGPLLGSIGTGSLQEIVGVNTSIDQIKGPDSKIPVKSPLTPPKLDVQTGDAAATAQAPSDLKTPIDTANKAVVTAMNAVTVINGKDPNWGKAPRDMTVFPQTEAEKTTPPAAGQTNQQTVQSYIDAAATSVRTLRSGQVSIDKTVKAAADAAANRVKL